MARKHARGEEMPAEPKRRRPRCDAASQDNDTARLTRVLDFNGVWKELKAAGWTHKLPRGLDNRYRYVLPGRSANGRDGEDFLLGEEASVSRVDLAMMMAGAVGPATMAVIVDLVTMVASRGLPHDSKPLFTRVSLATMVLSRHQPDGSKQLLTRKGFATMVAALWQRDLSVVPAVVFEFMGVGVGAVVVLAAAAEAVAEIELSGA
uniref:Uncharacterized protein n=1 Tax=Phytophthora ramorum TaxID=164328 RepID=H3GC41_PHYRM